ncbi:MAG TPA: HAD-IA family hydrolase [Methylomirabilota bacterium]|nr:HAD-IA family hydrolase [Methylomirabilota bacterium]
MAQSSLITTVLFDAGGTLVHVDHAFLQRVLRQAGIVVTRRQVREAECASKIAVDRRMQAAVTDTDETRRQPYFAAMLQQLGIAQETAKQLLLTFETEHKQNNLWRVMLPSTPRVLADLRARDVTLGVVSNSDGRIVSILDRCGITSFFDVVIDSHEVGVEKPDPRIFQFALEKAHARPEQTLYVGDIYSIDVVGARCAGIEPVLMDSVGCYTTAACKRIRHLRALLEMV